VGKDSGNALKGKRILVTRAAEQSQPLVQALKEKGAVPVVLTMVAFGPPDNPAKLDESIRGIAHYDWVFFTSQNALRAIQERCHSLNVNLAKAISGVHVAAVGPATAEAARSAGVNVSYLASKHRGVALAEELAEQVRGKHVLLPRSDKANPELVDRLTRLGAQVTEVVAYRTIAPKNADQSVEDAIARDAADAVLFFSPSAVHHLQDQVGSEKFLEFSRRAVFAAIGPVTADALHAAKVERVALARDTTVVAVIEALAEAFAEKVARISEGVKRG
jgi:uroporphyrinogen-III synthase